jgi:ethanolamine ammonia-lyase small subunit
MLPPQREAAPPAQGPVSRPDSWIALTRFTRARVALGRAGASWRTQTLLDFRLAHAQARDAVCRPFDPDYVEQQIKNLGFETARLSTEAPSRTEFLKRPDLGRRLSEDSRKLLTQNAAAWAGRNLAVIISDGLSSLAAETQAAPTLAKLLPSLAQAGWMICPIFVVPHARVKLQDEIGSLLKARHALALLGERPGLGSPDSLGAYFTYEPGPDKTDADRNCISNIRPDGLPPEEAAAKLAHLLLLSEKQRCSGIRLKEAKKSIPQSQRDDRQ